MTLAEAIEIIAYKTIADPDKKRKLANYIESLAADAELGIEAIEAIIKTDWEDSDTLPCSKYRTNNINKCADSTCGWNRFCRLRAGKGGE